MVRNMEARDLKRVMEIWLAGNREAHSFVPATYWEANAPMVEEQLQQAEVFVCERDGVVQGFAGLQGDYLAGIFVARPLPRHRKTAAGPHPARASVHHPARIPEKPGRCGLLPAGRVHGHGGGGGRRHRRDRIFCNA